MCANIPQNSKQTKKKRQKYIKIIILRAESLLIRKFIRTFAAHMREILFLNINI